MSASTTVSLINVLLKVFGHNEELWHRGISYKKHRTHTILHFRGYVRNEGLSIYDLLHYFKDSWVCVFCAVYSGMNDLKSN